MLKPHFLPLCVCVFVYKKRGFSIDQPHLKLNKNENKIIAHGSPKLLVTKKMFLNFNVVLLSTMSLVA